jgi:hypothetical protein
VQPQAVSRGFTTEFSFRFFQDDAAAVAGPCRVVDHSPDACTRRGGDGIALVLHTSGPAALGAAGAGLGYDGLPSGVALEFDTWADASAADPGDNHVAVLTRGNATLRRVARGAHGARGARCRIPHAPMVSRAGACACVRVRVPGRSTAPRWALRCRYRTWGTATATRCAPVPEARALLRIA